MKVVDHVEKTFAELGTPNKMKVYMGHGAKAWVCDFNHPHYMAGRKAMKTGESVGLKIYTDTSCTVIH